MKDRLGQAPDDTIVTFEAALGLAKAPDDTTAWGDLVEEANSPRHRNIGVPAILERVRSETHS